MAYKHILIAVDLSPESKVLVEKAVSELLLDAGRLPTMVMSSVSLSWRKIFTQL